MQSLRHLVVGTDFSRCAESALECAVTLANLGLARITVVHVCQLTELGSAPAEEDQLRSCQERLTALVASYSGCGVEVKGLLRTGKPWEKLNNAATDVGASLIVIGRIGETGVHSLGSVAKHLLRCATRPVVTVPVTEPALLPTAHARP